MDRETLIHGMNITSDAIIEFFDKLMALCCLYNVFGYDNVHIIKNDDLSFDVQFDKEDIPQIVHNRINGLNLKLYGTNYSIESSFGGYNVHIILHEPDRE